MNQPKNEIKEKKIYQKPLLLKVELIAEDAVLAVCKNGQGGECRPDLSCFSSQRS